MVLLEKLRGKWAIGVGIVIGIAMLAFVLTDFLMSGQALFGNTEMEVGSIHGEGIDYMRFMKRYEARANVQQALSGQALDERASEYLRDLVWESYVREGTLARTCEQLGLSVSPEELSSVILSVTNPHPIIHQLFTNPETGEYNREDVVNFLQNLDKAQPAQRAYWLEMEKEIEDQLLEEKYLLAVSRGLYVTKSDAEMRAGMRGRKVDAAYVLKSYASVPDSVVQITDSDARRYYKAHRKEYRQQERRDVSYVLFEVRPGPIDYERAEEWMKKYRDEFAAAGDAGRYASEVGDERYTGKWYAREELPPQVAGWAFDEATVGETTGIMAEADSYQAVRLLGRRTLPDSASARHILFSYQRYPAERAQALGDSVLGVLKQGGDFAELARRLSDDPGSATEGGDLGWFAQGTMVKPFGDACFMGAKGDRVVVASPFGVHVIEVLGHKGGAERVDVAVLRRRVEAGSETYQEVFNEASKFAALAHQPRPSWLARLFGAGKNRVREVSESMDTLLNARGLTRQEARDVELNGRSVNALPRSRELKQWVFKAHAGDVSPVLELEGQYVVAMLNRVKESEGGYATYEAVKERAAEGVRQERKAEMLGASLSAGSDVASIAQAAGEGVQRAAAVDVKSYAFGNAGNERAVLGAAVALDKGAVSGVVRGNGGVFVVEAESVAPADVDVNQVREEEQQLMRSRGKYQAYDVLKRMLKVEDRREKFF